MTKNPNPLQPLLPKHQKTIKRVLLISAVLFLAAAFSLSTWFANYYNINNADYVVYPQLFGQFQSGDIIFPGQHSNFLKFPLYALQSVMPYNELTLSIVNIGTHALAVLSWALLLVWVFGRKYLIPICIALGSLLVSSQLLALDFVGNTLRNIEFPIVFAFSALVVQTMLYGFYHSKLLYVMLGVLFSATVAGDSFFMYTVPFALLCLTLILAIKRLVTRNNLLRGALVLLASLTLAYIFRASVQPLGLGIYYTDPSFTTTLAPLDHIIASLKIVVKQLFELAGVDHDTPSLATTPLNVINFFVLSAGVVGLAWSIIAFLKPGTNRSVKKITLRETMVVFASLWFFIILAIYIFSGLVVTKLPDGSFVSSHQSRYIVILPYIALFGFLYALSKCKPRNTATFCSLASVLVLLSLPFLHQLFNYPRYGLSERVAIQKVARYIDKNDVDILVSGYWYGAPVRFWSQNKDLHIASVFGCNAASPNFNVRKSWYAPSEKPVRSSLVVATQGLDANMVDCPEEAVRATYGIPRSQKQIKAGANEATVYTYDYDLRQKIINRP
ncbi:MAG: hypothetical protein WBP26_05815 [Candidatus Saccharimonadales bacterium]